MVCVCCYAYACDGQHTRKAFVVELLVDHDDLLCVMSVSVMAIWLTGNCGQLATSLSLSLSLSLSMYIYIYIYTHTYIHICTYTHIIPHIYISYHVSNKFLILTKCAMLVVLYYALLTLWHA